MSLPHHLRPLQGISRGQSGSHLCSMHAPPEPEQLVKVCYVAATPTPGTTKALFHACAKRGCDCAPAPELGQARLPSGG